MLLASIPILLITTVASSILTYNIVDSQIRGEFDTEIEEQMNVALANLTLELDRTASVAKTLANYASTVPYTMTGEESEAFISTAVKYNETTVGCGIFYAEGQFPATYTDFASYGVYAYRNGDGTFGFTGDYAADAHSRDPRLGDFYVHDWWKVSAESKNGELVWSPLVYDPMPNEYMFSSVQPFYNDDGSLRGTGTADAHLTQIRAIAEQLTVGETGSAFLFSDKGQFIYSRNNQYDFSDNINSTGIAELSGFWQLVTSSPNGNVSEKLTINGEQKLLCSRLVTGPNWYLIIEVSESEISDSVLTAFFNIIIVPIIGFALMFISICVLASRFSSVASSVNHFAHAVLSGDFSKRLDVTENDEFGTMQKHLNSMVNHLELSYEQFTEMFLQTPLICTLWTDKGELIECNDVAARFFGTKTTEECVALFYTKLNDDYQSGVPFREMLAVHLKEASENGYVSFEWTHKKLDGTLVPTVVNLVRLPWKNTFRLAGYAQDKSSEIEARRQVAIQAAFIRRSPRVSACMDENGNLGYMNQALADIAGYSLEELEAGGIQKFLPASILEELRTIFFPAVRRGENPAFELDITRPDGTSRTLGGIMFPLDILGNNYPVAVAAQDVTDDKKFKLEIEEARDLAERGMEEARQYSRAKSDFLSRMSHEMRTPLNAIIGMSNIAKMSPDDLAKMSHCIDRISVASQHLLGVINDVLDMSKIEADKLELSPIDFNFEKMLSKIVNVMSFRLDERQLELKVRTDENIPDKLFADDQRLSQVIANLLSNAVKFTPEKGKITISARLLSDSDGVAEVEVSCKDNGIGISPEGIARLFGSFSQADETTSRKYGGTGLGLAISKRIVEMMGGEIRVESSVGEGANFVFTFRAAHGEQAAVPLLAPNINLSNVRILTVDDSPDILEYFDSCCRSLQLKHDTARSGEEALSLIKLNGHYDVYFLDWKMPGMDGITLARNIHKITDKNCVVIMISSSEWAAIKDDAKDAGIDRFLPKPLFKSAIADIINECLVDGEAGGATLYEQATYEGKTILLAEDIDVNREVVAALLEDTKITVDFAEDGLQAFQMYENNPLKYSLIFMDIHMPGTDGYTSTKMIRASASPRAGSIPIIAMTANVFTEDIEKCLACGMNGHIGKPVELSSMLQTLRKYIDT